MYFKPFDIIAIDIKQLAMWMDTLLAHSITKDRKCDERWIKIDYDYFLISGVGQSGED
jgi:hypothetical protein